MGRLIGIETEYGLAVEGKGPAQLVSESAALVRAYPGPAVTQWNYRAEDPRRDMRGFTVDRLASNPDDAQFSVGDGGAGAADDRADRVLANGARLYNDHGHPEYATPECRALLDVVAHDRAGERIVLECARRRAAEAGLSIHLYKNNTDFHGASYGTHECYLMRRDVPPDALIQGLAPFLATRQIYAGAGKVGVEGAQTGKSSGPVYQLSQRADFVAVEASVDTLHNRPLVNTRDEPHATPSVYRRLHVIVGDANMSQWACAMKVGATSLAVGLLESGWSPAIRLERPVNAMQSISRDPTLRWLVRTTDGGTVSAIDVQRHYLEAAREMLEGGDADAEWTVAEWATVLDDLEHDLTRVADRVDWLAKRRLLESYMADAGLDWTDPAMQSLDLAYHDIDPGAGLYAGLEQAGYVRRLVTDARIEAAMQCPPADTRAFLRGTMVSRFGAAVRSIGWNGVAFEHAGSDLVFDMNPLVEANVVALNEEVAQVGSLDEFVARIGAPAGD